MKTEFTDATIGLRPFRLDDIPLLYEAVQESKPELSLWMSWCHPNYSIDDSAAFVRSRDADWEKGEHYSFVVFDVKDGRFLGGAGLNFINRVHNFANLGYWVRSRDTGRGVATAATRLLARFAFEQLGFQRLEIVVATGNEPSRRVASKVGARFEGILRNRIQQQQGKMHDAAMFSLIPGDLNSSQVAAAPVDLRHRFATKADTALLAEMNYQLIRDEGHRNPMTVPELETRLKNWLRTEYQAVVFEHAAEVAAYAVYREEPESIYLRQFFVDRRRRCQGIGRAAIQILLGAVWPPGKRIVLEALAHNSVGHAFWKATGFKDYAITFEMLRS